MLKKFLYILCGISLGVVIYFTVMIGIKKYFNEEYYYTPKLIGLNIETAKKAVEDSPIKILNVAYEFSKEPLGAIYMQDPEEKFVIKSNRGIRLWVSKGANSETIPDIIGLNFIDAKYILENKGYTVGTIANVKLNLPVGEVIATEPPSGSVLLKAEKINLLVNSENKVYTVKVPDVIGLTLEEARTILKDSSLIVGDIQYEDFESLEPNIVIEISKEYNVETPAGTVINLIVSK
ncbi:MAG: PASTA domain-containing protein [Fusobacteriaceae bacterium]